VNRTVAVVVMLLVVVAAWGLMYVGWRARARRQSDVPSLPEAPSALVARAADGAEATYVSTTSAGDWLDRITVHGLGVRSAARVLVDPSGVLVARVGAPDVFVPASALRDVRRETMRAGKARPGAGLLVLEWTLGDRAVATALSPRLAAERDELEAAARGLLGVQP
jgi:hypothetical protein